MKRFDGKRILITGGTSGIGLATAKRIVEEGGEVGVTGTTQEHLDEAGKALPSGSMVLRNDASDPEAAKELAEKVRDQMGGIDGLFLNAGFGNNMAVDDINADDFDAMMNVNVRGMALHMAHLAPHLRDGGAVVLTGSVAGHLGLPAGAIYGASKAAVAAMGRSFARALAERTIRVNTIAPGPVETNFFDAFKNDSDEADELREQIARNVPLGRFAKDEEIAALAAFLLSDEASYVTGSEYVIDGGMTMR